MPTKRWNKKNCLDLHNKTEKHKSRSHFLYIVGVFFCTQNSIKGKIRHKRRRKAKPKTFYKELNEWWTVTYEYEKHTKACFSIIYAFKPHTFYLIISHFRPSFLSRSYFMLFPFHSFPSSFTSASFFFSCVVLSCAAFTSHKLPNLI